MKLLIAIITLFCLGALLGACASTDDSDNIRNGVAGEEVNSLCFIRQINGWQQLDDRRSDKLRG